MVYIINHFGHSGSLNWVFQGDFFFKLLLLVLEKIYLLLSSYVWSFANSYSLWRSRPCTTATYQVYRVLVPVKHLLLLVTSSNNNRSHSSTSSVARRDRLVVRTLRCGRSNPGSNPGPGKHSILACFWFQSSFLLV